MILAFDTCMDGCSVALSADGVILASAVDRRARGQAERLVPMLDDILHRAGVGGGDMAGIAVTVGPGSFTGARIGVAAARGLALAWGCPVMGATTLEILAMPARRAGMAGRLVACLPARDGSYFVQVIHSSGEIEAPPGLMSAPALARCLDADDTILCCTDPDRLPCPIGRTTVAPAITSLPAELLAGLAEEAPAARWRDAPAPVYARPPDALPSATGHLRPAGEGPG